MLNVASANGGAVYTEQESSFELIDCELSQNTAVEGSCLRLLACENSPSDVRNSKLYKNSATDSGTISVVLSTMNIYDSYIYQN